MERKNIYDMTNVSGKAISDAKRIQSQTATFLENYDAQLKESMEADEAAKMNAAMSGARFGYAANAARSAQRIHKMNEEIRYTQTSSVIGMTEMVAQVVENALLLDESELVKIYPDYKKDIRSMVRGYLEEGNINTNITKKETLALMEYIANKLPSVREGVSLTEDDLSNYIATNTPHDITRSIKNLGGDVATRVGALMEKEQEKALRINSDVKRAQAKAFKKDSQISAEDLIASIESGIMSENDLNHLLKDGEIDQNTYDEVIKFYEDLSTGELEIDEEDEELLASLQSQNPEVLQKLLNGENSPTVSSEAPPEEDPSAMGGDPSMMGAQVGEMGDPNAQGMNPAMAGQDPSAMGGDPSMMGAQGPAMMGQDPNAMGMDSSMAEQDPSAMGGDPSMMGANTPGVAPGQPKKQIQMLPDGTMNINIYESEFVRETPRCGLIESLAVNEATTMLSEGQDYDADLALSKAIMYVTITEAMDELGLMNADEKKYAHIISAAGGTLNEGGCSKNASVKNTKKFKKDPEVKKPEYDYGKPILESVLVNQYTPVRNDISNGDSLAERIRQKRLNEQKDILHD